MMKTVHLSSAQSSSFGYFCWLESLDSPMYGIMRIESPSFLPPRHPFECKSELPFVGVLSSGKELTDVPF